MKTRASTSPRWSRRGASLVEMLVAGCVGLIAVSVAVNILAWVGRGTAAVSSRDVAVREFKMATDALAQDLGSAVAIQADGSGFLRLAIDSAPFDGATTWVAPDRIVEYRLIGNGLSRQDSGSEYPIVVARPIEDFSVTQVPYGLEVVVIYGQGAQTHRLNLRIEAP